jgi:hypothetical protein
VVGVMPRRSRSNLQVSLCLLVRVEVQVDKIDINLVTLLGCTVINRVGLAQMLTL